MTNKTTTAAALTAATVARATREMERDPVPAAIAELCAARTGKPVTKRDADAIAAKFPGLACRIKREYGWTKIAWCAIVTQYDRTTERQVDVPEGRALVEMGAPAGYSNERDIIIARVETGAVWPNVEAFKAEHPAYYSARDERNAERAAAIARVEVDPTRTNLKRAAALVDALKAAMAELESVTADLPEEARREITALVAAPIRAARTESILWDIRYAATRND